jgi:hypothetical protein
LDATVADQIDERAEVLAKTLNALFNAVKGQRKETDTTEKAGVCPTIASQ